MFTCVFCLPFLGVSLGFSVPVGIRLWLRVRIRHSVIMV